VLDGTVFLILSDSNSFVLVVLGKIFNHKMSSEGGVPHPLCVLSFKHASEGGRESVVRLR